MNIVGFLFVGTFGALMIWISQLMRKDDRMKGFRDCPSAVGTVCCTQRVYRGNESTKRYEYKVEFRDQDGNDALGFSDSFCKKRTLENDEIVTFYYRKPKQGKYHGELQAFTNATMNAMTQTMFGKTHTPDPRPRYDIRFCDRKVYELEDTDTRKMARVFFLAGCVLLVLAVVVLLK